jgi:predicted dehydrogenase
VAIVGAGLMGRWHADAARHAGARVALVVDPDAAKADALARRHAGCRSAVDLASVLDGVDVVHVCTPTPSHAALARTAITAGRHVLVEKPLAATAADTAALLAEAAAHHVLLCPVHQFVFQDGVQRALDACASIAPLRHVEFHVCSAGADNGDDRQRQRIACEILVHPFSILARLAPHRIDRAAWTVQNPAPGEIQVLGAIDAMAVSLSISMRVRPTRNTMSIMGDGGTMQADLFHGFVLRSGARVSRSRKVAQPFATAGALAGAATANLARRTVRREAAYPGLRSLVERFYLATRGTAANPIAADETLEVARAVDAVAGALVWPR